MRGHDGVLGGRRPLFVLATHGEGSKGISHRSTTLSTAAIRKGTDTRSMGMGGGVRATAVVAVAASCLNFDHAIWDSSFNVVRRAIVDEGSILRVKGGISINEDAHAMLRLVLDTVLITVRST